MTVLRNSLPAHRTGVMSALPPPAQKRLPLAKSAPAVSAATKAGISAGSALPSASNMTTNSPVTRAKPVASALPFPLRTCWQVTASGRSRRAVASVSSTERPSTTITSCRSGTAAPSSGRTTSMLRASLSVGTTTLTRGRAGRWCRYARTQPSDWCYTPFKPPPWRADPLVRPVLRTATVGRPGYRPGARDAARVHPYRSEELVTDLTQSRPIRHGGGYTPLRRAAAGRARPRRRAG